MTARIFLLLAALASSALAQNTPQFFSSEMSGRDLEFLHKVGSASLLEANLGELAKKRGASDPVKLLGEAVATGHAASKTELQLLADKKHVSISNVPNKDQIALIDKISKLNGRDFDKTCMDEIVKAQQEEIAAYESAAKSADADIKAFAEKFLPQLREQLLLAKKLTVLASQPMPAMRGAMPERVK